MSKITNPRINTIYQEIMQTISVSSNNICSNSGTNAQVITIGDIQAKDCDVYITNLEQDINSKISVSCIQSSNFNDLVKTAIDNKINEISVGEPVLADELRTVFNTEVVVKQLTECMANTLNTQAINIGDISNMCASNGGKIIISDLVQKILSDVMFSCMQKTDSPNIVEKLNRIPLVQPSIPKNNQIDAAQIAGIAIGIVLLLVVISLILYFTLRPSRP